jgi:hypothetical protein
VHSLVFWRRSPQVDPPRRPSHGRPVQSDRGPSSALGQHRLTTQTRRSGFSKAARRLDRPLQGSASTKQPFMATWSRPSAVAHGRQLRGELKIIAAILEQPVIERILMHLGLQARAPPRPQPVGRLCCTPPERTEPMTVHLVKRQGLRGSAAPGLFKTETKRPTRRGRPANEPAAERVRPGSSARGGHRRPQEPQSEPRQAGPTTPSSRQKGL